MGRDVVSHLLFLSKGNKTLISLISGKYGKNVNKYTMFKVCKESFFKSLSH